MFHRLAVPSYFGGLPAGYDLINDPTHPSVGGSGVAALADGQKSGGPNDGTYFVAFGEDGLSEVVNRPIKALAENTDLLDDILRTSIPTVTFADATAVGAVSAINLVGQIYVGKSGAANNQPQRDRIVRITDQNNNDLEVSGSKIVATLIHDGASVNVVGTQASGFRTNASVTVAPPIPNGTAYRVWHGIRNNYANISLTDKGALFEEMLRVIQNVSGEVRSLFRQVHSETSVNQAWDAPFDSTIRSLASAGLNERYRRATLQPAGFTTPDFNVAGSGAVITRDGQAVTIKTQILTITNVADLPDNNAAALKIENTYTRGDASGVTHVQGGDFGYWHEIEWRAQDANDSGMRSRTASSGPALVEVIPYDIREDDYDGDPFFTRISPVDATATLNPDSAVGAAPQATIQCATGQFFALTSPTRTAIRLGVDLLEVIRTNGDTITVVIDELVSATRVRVRALSGGAMNFGAIAVPNIALRWIQPIVKIGGSLLTDAAAGHPLVSGVNVLTRPIVAIPPAGLTTVVANELVALPSFFGAQTGSVVDAIAQARRARALEWGATASPDSGGIVNGTITARGWLNGDGSLHATNGVFTGTLVVTGEVTFTGDLGVDDITADDVVVDTIRVLRPERYFHFREDWLRFLQEFTPDIIHADRHWDFDEIEDVFTLNNGTPSNKNPGQLQVIGAGGGTSRQLSIRPTNLLPFSFANILSATIVVAVTDDPANVATSCTIGFVDNTSAQNGGSDSINLFYGPSVGWRLQHRVGGADGAHNFAVLGAKTDGAFVVLRLLKIANGDVQVYFNDVLSLTITSAQLPAGLCTFGMYFIQSIADTDATIFTVDFTDFIVDTGSTRSGAP